MIRRAALITLAVAIAGGLMTASAGGATASVPGTACTRSAVVTIKSFAFHPASIRRGQSSPATLTAVNCTGRTQRATEIWFGKYTRPSGGLPRDCPVIDPLPVPVRFSPHGTASRHVTYLAPRGCMATRLVITVSIDGSSGKVLAGGTAVLRIT